MFAKFNRLLVISLLITGMIALSGSWTKLWAPVYPSFGGWSIYPGSITAESLLQHLRNVDNNPVSVAVHMTNVAATFRCQNNGGNADTANGEPFTWEGALTGLQTLTDGEISKNGRAISDISFSDKEIFDDFFCPEGTTCSEPDDYVFPEGICQNQNWSPVIPGPTDDGLITVNQTDALYLLWWDDDGDGTPYGVTTGSPMILADVVAVRCYLNEAGTAYNCIDCPGGNGNAPTQNAVYGTGIGTYADFFTDGWSGCTTPPEF